MIPGTLHYPPELDANHSRIFMGLAWPAKRRGFAVVVGEHRTDCSAGKPKLILLDEASETRLWHVVEQAAALQAYYHPERILADTNHVAAMQLVHEFADRGLAVQPSPVCALQGPLVYALPLLRHLADQGRLVIPPGSALQAELMTAPVHEDLSKLILADYPGIAALAFAVLELERSRDSGQVRPTEAEGPGRIL